MFTEQIAPDRVRCWLWTGTRNSDDDYARWVAAIVACQRETSPTVLMIVDQGNPPPPPVWRRQIAEATTHPPPDSLFAMVTTSAIVRGAVTALNWIRPSTFETLIHATVADAASALADRGRMRRERVLELVARTREKAERGS